MQNMPLYLFAPLFDFHKKREKYKDKRAYSSQVPWSIWDQDKH